MDIIERRAAGVITEDLQDIEAVFINGPRQAGKSTFAENFGKQYDKVFYASFDDISLRAAETASPGQVFADAREGLVILDEIQYIPNTFPALKVKIDDVRRKKQNLKFLLTGSADIMLLPKLSETLVGRMYVRTLYPFSAAEALQKPGTFIRSIFKSDPDMALQFSKPDIAAVMAKASFPKLSLEVKNHSPWFQNYISILLDRDVKNLSDIDRLEALPQLLTILASRTGGLLNDAELSIAVKLSQPTLKRYRALLNGVFLTHLIPPWYRDIEKRLVKSPKIYFTDTLLLCHLLGRTPAELEAKQPELFGFVLENFTASELLKELSLMTGCKLYHFRTSDRKEVDFLIEAQNGDLLALEVKASSHVTPDDFKHIRFLQTAYGHLVRGIVLYRGDRVIRFSENLYAMPLSALWEL
jgi:predicted AAA+ superfamily ATPase